MINDNNNDQYCENNEINEICCISMGRTGTNYLCSLLDSVNNIVSCREIFSFDKCYVPEYVENEIKKRLNLTNDKEVTKWAHEHIFKFMNILREIKIHNNKSYLFYKIFLCSWQLNYDQLEKNFMTNPNIGYFYLTRNYLSVYVSLKKAQQINCWNKINTSNVKIIFNPNEFNNYVKLYDDMFNKILKLCKKYDRKLLIITYEEMMNYESDIERLEFIRNKFMDKFGVKLELPEQISTKFFKQDNSDIKDSISNYNDFEKFVEQNNMEKY